MKILLILIACILIWVVFRKIEIRWRKETRIIKEKEERQNERQQRLIEIRKIKLYNKDGYEEETKEKIGKLEEKIDNCIDIILKEEEEKDIDKAIEDIKREWEELRGKMKICHLEIDKLISELEEKKDYIAEYLSQTNFYPFQFALDNNKLSGIIVELKENRKKNPFLDTRSYETFATELYEKVLDFQHLHQTVVKLIEQVEGEKENYPTSKYKRVMEVKNDLYLYLHKGDSENTKKYIKELRHLVK